MKFPDTIQVLHGTTGLRFPFPAKIFGPLAVHRKPLRGDTPDIIIEGKTFSISFVETGHVLLSGLKVKKAVALAKGMAEWPEWKSEYLHTPTSAPRDFMRKLRDKVHATAGIKS